MNPVLRPALLAGALLTIGVGVVLYLAIDETIGIVVAALGVVDLLTMPLVMRMLARAQARAGDPSSSPPSAAGEDSAYGTETEPPGPDPTYNPYARED